MRRRLALVAGALVLSGCTPNAMIEFLYPTCKQQHTSCEDAKRNEGMNREPPWKIDDSHWDGHVKSFEPIGAQKKGVRVVHVDTLVTPDTIFPQPAPSSQL
ncbi:MAG TPA: hypothetical protein VGO46_03190 [Gemmatimonadaceae bacterium]|jgi:hypothetical protein|nr:hypothetical protein [Gemmatimonadaceae bacterium]